MAELVSKCIFIFLLCSSAVSSMEDLQEMKKKDQRFPSSRRELSHGLNIKTLVTPDNPSPTIITVPATIPPNPVTVTPTNPAATPLPIPATTPVTVPSTNPNNPTVPVTTPAPITGAQPVTNPVTTYPPPAAGGVPVTTPGTNPVPPPAATNAPAIPGQSWCVAKTGASQTSLQTALDYACGMGGADCSQIQQGASCYNPNSLQNHASYAFNNYYQKNPVPTSCDFGGTAVIVSSNPSSGSCIYPSSAAASTSTPTPVTTPSTSTPTPVTTPSTATPTPITTPTTSGGGVPGSGTPPLLMNSSTSGSPTTTFPGFDIPSSFNSTSMSSGLRPFVGCVILLTSFVTGAIILDA